MMNLKIEADEVINVLFRSHGILHGRGIMIGQQMSGNTSLQIHQTKSVLQSTAVMILSLATRQPVQIDQRTKMSITTIHRFQPIMSKVYDLRIQRIRYKNPSMSHNKPFQVCFSMFITLLPFFRHTGFSNLTWFSN